jgi:hypothetical protein
MGSTGIRGGPSLLKLGHGMWYLLVFTRLGDPMRVDASCTSKHTNTWKVSRYPYQLVTGIGRLNFFFLPSWPQLHLFANLKLSWRLSKLPQVFFPSSSESRRVPITPHSFVVFLFFLYFFFVSRQRIGVATPNTINTIDSSLVCPLNGDSNS